jgi:aryl-alcohol dehydrogenase-like predicted oxidoreductase
MHQRRLGDVLVGAVGLGAMPLSMPGRPDEADAVRTIHAALDAGVSLIDTADAYGLDAAEVGHNERLVASALRSRSGDTSHVLVATKGSVRRGPGGRWQYDARPEYLRSACEASLRALGVERIGLYQLHRPDPTVPYAESVGALEQLRVEGKLAMIGISNASTEQLDEARSVTTVVSVQNHWSLDFRAGEADLRSCVERGVGFLAWRPLGGGDAARMLGEAHPAFGQVARERGVSAQRVCLAWMLAKAPTVIPIPGARRPQSIEDSAAAADLVLTPDELTRLDAEG